MFKWAAVTIFLTSATASVAEDAKGRDLMAEALRLFMNGLMRELEPGIDELQTLFQDLSAYNPPEILPNGDIIIRRKKPLELLDEDGEVDI